MSTTRAVLFALDAALIGAVWPHVRRASRPDSQSRFTLTIDVRGLAYRIFDLLLLFAMGMYRREAILQSGHSLVRVPLVVGMGAALAILGSLLQPLLISTVAMKGGRDQAMLFALAVVSFTFCALFARLVMYVLKRHHVLRRRLLIVGAGQRAWDLLLMLGRRAAARAMTSRWCTANRTPSIRGCSPIRRAASCVRLASTSLQPPARSMWT